MPSERTEITELVTGLGTLGFPTFAAAVRARPVEVTNVRVDQWERLEHMLTVARHQATFEAAWANGRALLDARDGLRGRSPLLVEWKGPHGSVGDQVAPVDLRIDHVYLVSCKYFSRILHNVAPASVFDHGLLGSHSRSGTDWYQVVAPTEYQALYEAVGDALGIRNDLPRSVEDLTVEHRRLLKAQLRDEWPGDSRAAYSALAFQVSVASVTRWRSWLANRRAQAAMLWRLLRIGSAPYFVLGTSATTSLRLRIATPWDWQQGFELRAFDVWAHSAGQPVARWRATVTDRVRDTEVEIKGHIEIRWTHGRFAQPPEAKIYLDTPHHEVPGYNPLA